MGLQHSAGDLLEDGAVQMGSDPWERGIISPSSMYMSRKDAAMLERAKEV